MLSNGKCTHLHYDTATKKWSTHTYDKIIWQETDGARLDKQGLTLDYSVKLFLPSNSPISITPGKDFFVWGLVTGQINNSSEQTQSESLKQIPEKFTVVSSKKALYGYSQGLHHYEILLR